MSDNDVKRDASTLMKAREVHQERAPPKDANEVMSADLENDEESPSMAVGIEGERERERRSNM